MGILVKSSKNQRLNRVMSDKSIAYKCLPGLLLFIMSYPVYGKTAASGWEEDDNETPPYKTIEDKEPNIPGLPSAPDEVNKGLTPLSPITDPTVQPIDTSSVSPESEFIEAAASTPDAVESLFGKSAAQKKSSNWFLNPTPIPWLDSLTSKTQQTAREATKIPNKITRKTTNLISDPHFRDMAARTVIIGGAGVGAYFLFRSLNNMNKPRVHWVEPYITKDGVYVPGHWQSDSDDDKYNNFSTKGNINPFTGRRGTVIPTP